MIPVTLVTEDVLSSQVARRLLSESGRAYRVDREFPGRGMRRFAAGSGQIEKRITGFNRGAAYSPFVVFLDLDDRQCSPGYVRQLLPTGASRYMLLRIVVREIEGWIIADRDGTAEFLCVAPSHVPQHPDGILDPRSALFDVVRKSRKRTLKQAILPTDRSTRIGPDYNAAMMRMVDEYWSPDRAAAASPSLARAMSAIERLTYP